MKKQAYTTMTEHADQHQSPIEPLRPETVMRAIVQESTLYPGTFYALIETIPASGKPYRRRASGHHVATAEAALARAEEIIAAHRKAGTVPAPGKAADHTPEA